MIPTYHPIDTHTVKVIAGMLRAYRQILMDTDPPQGGLDDLICAEIEEAGELIKMLRKRAYA